MNGSNLRRSDHGENLPFLPPRQQCFYDLLAKELANDFAGAGNDGRNKIMGAQNQGEMFMIVSPP